MTTMLLISVMLTAGLLKENQPVQMPVQVSFPSGNISVLTAQADEGWLEVDRTWLIPREGEEPLRVGLYGIWQLEEPPEGMQAASLGLCDAFAFLEEGEELQSFHESDTTVDYPSRRVSAQTRLAVRSEGDYWGPESLGFSWELPQLTRTQEGETE